jgi:hypothetical protein
VNKNVFFAIETHKCEVRPHVPPLIKLVSDNELAIGRKLPGRAKAARNVGNPAEFIVRQTGKRKKWSSAVS